MRESAKEKLILKTNNQSNTIIFVFGHFINILQSCYNKLLTLIKTRPIDFMNILSENIAESSYKIPHNE